MLVFLSANLAASHLLLRLRYASAANKNPAQLPVSAVASHFQQLILTTSSKSDLCARLPKILAIYCVCLLSKTCVFRRNISKEVIQPQVPLRLPCYDFVPVMNHTVAGVSLSVKLPASGTIHSHDVTGGVYKARERIHRDNADSRLLAIPTSWSRVADSNPDYETL